MFKVYFQLVRQHVYVVFYLRGARSMLSLGIYMPDTFWQHGYVTKNHPEYRKIVEKLEHYTTLSYACINILKEQKGNKATILDLKHTFKGLIEKNQLEEYGSLNVRVGFTMVEDFKKFIERRKGHVKHSTIKKYGTTRNALEDFEVHAGLKLDVDIFDKHMFEQFVSYLLLTRQNMNNTVAKHAAVLKAFYNDTYPDVDNKFIAYHEYRPEVIALTEQELMQLIGTPFTGIKERAKDLFVFLATTGMRISDAKRFNPNWVTRDLISYSAHKNMSKAYVPLLETAKGVLEKYDGVPPYMPDPVFNRTIKKVIADCGMDRAVIERHRTGKEELQVISPLHEVVSSHTGRKTFISMMLERGVPIQDVMNMSGHQDYRSMKPYIQINQDHMRMYKNKLGL